MRKRIYKKDKSEMTYEQAVAVVALNDGDGDDERLRLDHVSSIVGVVIAADIFGIEPTKFAKAVIAYRRKNP